MLNNYVNVGKALIESGHHIVLLPTKLAAKPKKGIRTKWQDRPATVESLKASDVGGVAIMMGQGYWGLDCDSDVTAAVASRVTQLQPGYWSTHYRGETRHYIYRLDTDSRDKTPGASVYVDKLINPRTDCKTKPSELPWEQYQVEAITGNKYLAVAPCHEPREFRWNASKPPPVFSIEAANQLTYYVALGAFLIKHAPAAGSRNEYWLAASGLMACKGIPLGYAELILQSLFDLHGRDAAGSSHGSYQAARQNVLERSYTRLGAGEQVGSDIAGRFADVDALEVRSLNALYKAFDPEFGQSSGAGRPNTVSRQGYGKAIDRLKGIVSKAREAAPEGSPWDYACAGFIRIAGRENCMLLFRLGAAVFPRIQGTGASHVAARGVAPGFPLVADLFNNGKPESTVKWLKELPEVAYKDWKVGEIGMPLYDSESHLIDVMMPLFAVEPADTLDDTQALGWRLLNSIGRNAAGGEQYWNNIRLIMAYQAANPLRRPLDKLICLSGIGGSGKSRLYNLYASIWNEHRQGGSIPQRDLGEAFLHDVASKHVVQVSEFGRRPGLGPMSSRQSLGEERQLLPNSFTEILKLFTGERSAAVKLKFENREKVALRLLVFASSNNVEAVKELVDTEGFERRLVVGYQNSTTLEDVLDDAESELLELLDDNYTDEGKARIAHVAAGILSELQRIGNSLTAAERRAIRKLNRGDMPPDLTRGSGEGVAPPKQVKIQYQRRGSNDQ